jgi:hypothetical protein
LTAAEYFFIVGQPKPKPSLKPELSQLGLKVAINISLIVFLSSFSSFFFLTNQKAHRRSDLRQKL